MAPLRFLVIEDSEADFLLHQRNLVKNGMAADLHRVESSAGLEAALAETGWDAVISDYNLPGMEFRSTLERLKDRLPGVPIILVSGNIGEETALRLLKEGVWDFVWKDRPAGLAQTLDHCLEEARTRKARLQAEVALRSSESRYRSLFENMLDGFAHCRMILQDGIPVDWVYLSVNPSFERLTGLKDVVGRRVSEVIPGILASNGDLVQAFGRVAATGVPERLESYVPTLGIWFSIAVYSSAPGDFIAVFANITERKDAENSLMEAMCRLRMAIAVGGFGVWDRHLQPDLLFWDEQMGRIYGTHAPDLDASMALLHPEDRSRFLDGVQTALEGKDELDLQHRIIRPDGLVRHVHTLGIVVRDTEARPLRMLGLAQDVTERVEAERARLEGEEKRRDLEAQIRHAEKLESLGHLASGMAHDMNNVLAAILAVGEVLSLRQGLDAGMVSALDTILKAGNRGRDLVRGLVNFARKDLRAPQPLDLNQMVRDEAALLERTLRQKIRLVVDLEEPLPPFQGESGNFGSALMNLCVNAVDAMPQNGTLTLRTRHGEPGWIEVVVADTGSGMTPEVLERAMEPFFTTKEAGKGTGLGLAMVHGTVKSHGGVLEIRSQVGQGTSIHIRLPAITERLEGPAADRAAAPRQKGSLKVLVVDDDELIQATVPLLLHHLGHRHLLAASGEEALELLAGDLEVDVVILDLNMPGMGGEATLLGIRQRYPRLPVLVATGYMDPSTSSLVQGDPWTGRIMKPFSVDELRRALTWDEAGRRFGVSP